MREERDPLEEELSAFRPAPITPALWQRIESRLAKGGKSRRRGIAAIVALAAACLLWLLLSPRPLEKVVPLPPGPSAVGKEPLPSFAVYRQALSQSPEALEELLDRQAAATCRPESRPMTAIGARRDDASWAQ